MVDIHCHILYGLDDGSACLEESVEMAKTAYDGGTEAIIATSHSNIAGSYMNLWNEEFDKRIFLINDRLKEAGFNINIYPGQEIFCDEGTLNRLNTGKLITLNHSVYPLVEFNFFEHSSFVLKRVSELVASGYIPVIAHPERYSFVCENPMVIYNLKQSGALIQINKGSLRGNFGKSAFNVSEFILKSRLADFVASDAHSPFSRTPYLEGVFEYVAENFSFDYANFLFNENPCRVIGNKKILNF